MLCFLNSLRAVRLVLSEAMETSSSAALMRHLPLLNPAMCHLPHLIPCRRSQQSCCGSVYIPLDPAAPSQLAPWEWKGWLEMCKGTGDIETALSECCRKGRGVDSMLWLEKAGKHHFCARLPLWLPQSGSVPLFQAAERTALLHLPRMQ